MSHCGVWRYWLQTVPGLEAAPALPAPLEASLAASVMRLSKRGVCAGRDWPSDGVAVEVRRTGTGRSGAVATRLPLLAKLALQGCLDRLQHDKVAVIVEMGTVDLNVQPPCPVF